VARRPGVERADRDGGAPEARPDVADGRDEAHAVQQREAPGAADGRRGDEDQLRARPHAPDARQHGRREAKRGVDVRAEAEIAGEDDPVRVTAAAERVAREVETGGHDVDPVERHVAADLRAIFVRRHDAGRGVREPAVRPRLVAAIGDPPREPVEPRAAEPSHRGVGQPRRARGEHGRCRRRRGERGDHRAVEIHDVGCEGADAALERRLQARQTDVGIAGERTAPARRGENLGEGRAATGPAPLQIRVDGIRGGEHADGVARGEGAEQLRRVGAGRVGTRQVWRPLGHEEDAQGLTRGSRPP